MANKKLPVHVLSRDEGWAVVREGNDRATSVHPTQAEAAKAGREIARKNKTTFLLHAKDGRVRDRSDYGEDATSRPKDGPASSAGGVAGDVVGATTQATGGAVGLASGGVGGAIEGLGPATTGVGQDSGPPHEEKEPDDTEEVGGLAYEERYADYDVYDQLGKSLGKVDTLFLDEDDELEYVGVKTGLLGTRSTLIPAEVVTIDDQQGRMVVARSSNVVEQGPTLADEEETTPEFEERVRLHYGLDRAARSGTYGTYHGGTFEGSTGAEKSETQGPSTSDSSRAPSEDEIRVQRSEEELVVGTTRREAGALRIRKRVRTEHERLEVPIKREEVHVERVPVSGEARTEAEIGEEEIVVPVTEEEVVVSKRPMVKEEVRVRKDVVEETEVVEEDVRREEIDVEDETERRDL